MSKKYKTFDEFLVALVKQLDKNKNGFVEFDELSDGLKEFLILYDINFKAWIQLNILGIIHVV